MTDDNGETAEVVTLNKGAKPVIFLDYSFMVNVRANVLLATGIAKGVAAYFHLVEDADDLSEECRFELDLLYKKLRDYGQFALVASECNAVTAHYRFVVDAIFRLRELEFLSSSALGWARSVDRGLESMVRDTMWASQHISDRFRYGEALVVTVLAHLFGKGKPKDFLLDLCKFFAVELKLPIIMAQFHFVPTDESMLYAAESASKERHPLFTTILDPEDNVNVAATLMVYERWVITVKESIWTHPPWYLV
jgi:hypothetical protein